MVMRRAQIQDKLDNIAKARKQKEIDLDITNKAVDEYKKEEATKKLHLEHAMNLYKRDVKGQMEEDSKHKKIAKAGEDVVNKQVFEAERVLQNKVADALAKFNTEAAVAREERRRQLGFNDLLPSANQPTRFKPPTPEVLDPVQAALSDLYIHKSGYGHAEGVL